MAPNRPLSTQVTTSIAVMTAYYTNMLSWCPLMCCMVRATCEHVHKMTVRNPRPQLSQLFPLKVEKLSLSLCSGDDRQILDDVNPLVNFALYVHSSLQKI